MRGTTTASIYMSPTRRKQVQDAPRRRHQIFKWKVPATADGKSFFVAGQLDYVPPKKSAFPVVITVGLLGLISAGMVGLFALRRVLTRSLEDGPRRNRCRHRIR